VKWTAPSFEHKGRRDRVHLSGEFRVSDGVTPIRFPKALRNCTFGENVAAPLLTTTQHPLVRGAGFSANLRETQIYPISSMSVLG
jgi:hypothetical protein